MRTQDVTPYPHCGSQSCRSLALVPSVVVYKSVISISRHDHRGYQAYSLFTTAKYVNSEARQEALLRAHWGMADPLDHSKYREFETNSILRREQIACATDMTLFGYDQGVFSGVVVTEDFLVVHDLVGPTKTKALSTVTAIYDVGCFLGSILAFIVSERLGRKKSILLGTTIMAVGTILQASSYSLAQMFVGRVILGIGNGINTSTAPVWQTETATVKWRGKLVILEMALNVSGFALVNWINYGLSFKGGALAWRLPIALQFFFIFILYATVPWLPESPRWLLSHGHNEQALDVISRIEAKPVDDPYIITQYNEIEYSINYERENAVSWTDLLLRRQKTNDTKTLRRILLAVPRQVSLQLDGHWLTVHRNQYHVLLPSSGADQLCRPVKQHVTTPQCLQRDILLCVCLCSSHHGGAVRSKRPNADVDLWPVCLFPDHHYPPSICGERPKVWYRFSGILLSVLHCVWNRHAGCSLAVSDGDQFSSYADEGCGCLVCDELVCYYPLSGHCVCIFTMHRITNFVIVEITPIGIQNIGWKFWIVWTITNAASLPIIYYLYPETANRTLEDLDAYYRSNPPLIVTGDPDAISTGRPLKYIQHEDEELQRQIKQRQATGEEDRLKR
ncbi:putative MFS sugar transporte [Aspergillus fumigatus Af293]|uniref:MFS sugar transporte, putative n=2 Tax=Aspergillus fumigatus TaxID=746128 RepID=Q4WFS1_ASPFU|nr:MFS sugar transporte, putative [Aspergillus fumigatus Af293]EAL86406.1 MFS sugar transporte, putative [Aspergillus fumigatus Af293]EDP53534.1 MFS sugar transporte, putative [Aspergillus fumigatus A1163]